MRLLFLLPLFLLPLSSGADEPAGKPNILFILTDDLGYGDLGITWQNQRNSDKKHLTPHLDRFASEGVLMTRHYCPAPVCAPSRGSFLTGMHQGHCEVRDNQFDKALPDDHTIASALRSQGYRTALIGKYGLQGTGRSAATWPAYPTKRGFDEFLGYVRHVDGHHHYPAHHWPKGDSERHRSPKELWHNDREISAGLSKCFTSDLFTAYAKHWITEQVRASPGKPFFLYLAYDTPHAALQLPTSAYPKGSGLAGGLQWLGKPGKMINTAVGAIDSWVHPDYEKPGWTDEDKRQATMIRRIDDHIGDLVQLLKDLAIDDNTLVVFTSDNGPHSESYLEGGTYQANAFQAYGPHDGIKRDVLEGGIRTPTLVRWPGTIPPGKENRTPSQFHDWMTTFLAAAGAPLPAQADGVSLLPTLTGKGGQATPTTYVEYSVSGRTPSYQDFDPSHRRQQRGQQQVIFLDGYKGIRRNLTSHADAFEIFDLEKDPQEIHDLAQSDRKFRELEARMRDQVLRIRIPNSSAERPYDREAIPALKPAPDVQAGIESLFLAGKFPWAPRLAGLRGTVARMLPDLAVETPKPGALELHGYLEVPETGLYEFHLTTGSSAVLRLHESLVIDADTPGGDGGTYSRSIMLEKGLHPFRLNALTLTQAPTLTWSGPGIEAQAIPGTRLHRERRP